MKVAGVASAIVILSYLYYEKSDPLSSLEIGNGKVG